MEPQIEKIIKLSLALIVTLSLLAYWLIPKLKLSSKLRMNDNVFVITHSIGILCGIAGIFLTLIYPKNIIELHLWELLIMPYVIVQVYWLTLMKIQKTAEIIDEKQDYDMNRAGGITFGFSIPAMVILFMLYQNEILNGIIWFPYYVFVSILIFSSANLFRFVKS